MSFASISFLIFMVAVFMIYWILPHQYRWAALLAANVIFYACSARFLLLILIFITHLRTFVLHSCKCIIKSEQLFVNRLSNICFVNNK